MFLFWLYFDFQVTLPRTQQHMKSMIAFAYLDLCTSLDLVSAIRLHLAIDYLVESKVLGHCSSSDGLVTCLSGPTAYWISRTEHGQANLNYVSPGHYIFITHSLFVPLTFVLLMQIVPHLDQLRLCIVMAI